MEVNLSLTGISVGLVQCDTTLPAQHSTPRRKHAPEQRLMVAVPCPPLPVGQWRAGGPTDAGRGAAQE